MKVIILIIFILISNFLFCQKTYSNMITYYEFNFCGSPQSLVVIKKKNNKYFGYILANLERVGEKHKKIIKKSKISSEQSKKIISELEEKRIDLVDQRYDDGKEFYLDGDVLTIKLLRNDTIETFYFDEIYPISKKKSEVTPLRSKVQNWLTIIDNRVNLKDSFSKIILTLRRGTYCYDNGINNICFKKK